MTLDYLRPFIISLVIGFLIGIERERSHPAGYKPAGVRSFVLFALLGTLAATIQNPGITLALTLFAFAAILLGYYRSSQPKLPIAVRGLTTELAGAAVFCLGFLAPSNGLLATILGGVILLILIGRERLHHFARKQIQPKEIQATVTLLIISIAILIFLPDRTIDPWQLFNPRKFGILVILLAVIQFGGYVAIRVFGARLGMALTGFFGGLISSTAVFASLPRYSRDHPAMLFALVSAAIFSVIGTFLELLIILFVAAPALMKAVLLPIGTMIAVGATAGIFTAKRNSNNEIISKSNNPLDVKSVIKLATFIASMIIIVALAKRYIGSEGVQLVSFFGGLFETHSVSLANATLLVQNKLTLAQAKQAIGITILASYTSKFILLWSLARNRFTLITSLFLTGMLIVGVVVFIFT